MARRAKSECILPSTLTAYGGSGCCSMASSSDGIAVAAATDAYINIYPVSSIWMPCVSIPLPAEISEYNNRLHNKICRYPECLYKLKYPRYVKPDDTVVRRKPGKKRNVFNGIIQILRFHGENNQYLVGVGPFLFVIYDLRTMSMKPIICMDMRYFGVNARGYPHPLQASFETLNITRDYMYNNQRLSCIDFIFSIKPFVPTYFRVLFNEDKNWWVVDCRSTVPIISKDCLDEEVPYLYYNYDNSKLPNTDEVVEEEGEEDNYDEQNELKEFNNTLELVQKDIDVNNEYHPNTGFFNSSEMLREMDLDGSETRLSHVVNNRDLMDPENMENSKTGDTTPNNYDSENYESDVEEDDDNTKDLNENEDNENDKNNNNSNKNDNSNYNNTDNDNNDNNTDDNSNNNTNNPSQMLSRSIFNGVYHPFCILEKKVDFHRSKINELAKVVKDAQLSYTQEFLIVTFVPLGTVVMIKFSVENRFYVRNSRVEHSQLCQTSSKVLTDLVISHLVPKVHTFSARRHGRVFTMILNERFYVLKYTAPSMVSLSLMVDEEDDQKCREYVKLEMEDFNFYNYNFNDNNDDIDYDMMETDSDNSNNNDSKASEENNGTDYNNTDNDNNDNNTDDNGQNNTYNNNEEESENKDENPDENDLNKLEYDELSVPNDLNINKNYRICYIDDDTEYSIYTHFSHYDPVLKLHYTVASFDLSKSDGYMAICTNYTSQWGLQIFSLASQTGIDGLRLVLDSSKCKGFSHISWLPYTKKLLAVSRINGELFQLEPKTQRNWVGLISNFTCIDKNVEYIESEDAFDIGPDGEMTSPIVVKQEFSLSKKDPSKDEKYKGLGWKRDCYRYPFFHTGFSIIGPVWFNVKQGIKASEDDPLYHVEDQEVKDKYMKWLDSSKLL